jgi:RHS repeat-associated protein
LGFRRFKEVVGQYQRWFVYDLGASEVPGLAPLVAEYDGNGNLVAKYHYDGGGLLAMTRNNQSYWYGFEGIGTVRQLMGSQGQVVDAYAFDAWGNELTSPQSQVQNPFKYVGKHGYYLDTESALMLLGVRYYGAGTGRFVTTDPLNSGINWYSYGYDNPCRFIDFTGLFIFCPRTECEWVITRHEWSLGVCQGYLYGHWYQGLEWMVHVHKRKVCREYGWIWWASCWWPLPQCVLKRIYTAEYQFECWRECRVNAPSPRCVNICIALIGSLVSVGCPMLCDALCASLSGPAFGLCVVGCGIACNALGGYVIPSALCPSLCQALGFTEGVPVSKSPC